MTRAQHAVQRAAGIAQAVTAFCLQDRANQRVHRGVGDASEVVAAVLFAGFAVPKRADFRPRRRCKRKTFSRDVELVAPQPLLFFGRIHAANRCVHAEVAEPVRVRADDPFGGWVIDQKLKVEGFAACVATRAVFERPARLVEKLRGFAQAGTEPA